MANVYGYIRVSSRDQNEDRQMIALKEVGVADRNIYLDKQSGKCKNRRHYTTCTDEIGHRHGAVGQSTLRQKFHGRI